MLITILIEFEIIYMTCFLPDTFFLMQRHKAISSLQLFPWQMSRRAPFFSSTILDRFHQETPCYFHYFSRVRNVMKFFIFYELSLCGTDPFVSVSMNAFILNSPRQSIIVAYPPNLHFLTLALHFISQTSVLTNSSDSRAIYSMIYS